MAGLLAGALAGCGGGGGTAASTPGGSGTTPTTPTTPAGAAASITAAAATPANDTGTTPTAAFAVVQAAGVPAVTINSPPVVNFTVISDGAVVKGLTTSNARFIIAKLVPGTNGSPDQWVSYVNKTVTSLAGFGPGATPTPVLASATQPTTDSGGTLVYNDAGYYTYTFGTDVKANTGATAFDPNATSRVAIQLSYTNAAGQTVLVNPYFDFTIDASGNSVPVTDASKDHKVVDITSCNQCHDKLALHGGGRVDTQYCVTCHNAGNTDPYSGNVLDFRIMVHKIHAGELLQSAFNQDYSVWGYPPTKPSQSDFNDVRFPQDLRNCTKCHDDTSKDAAGNLLNPQADNYKTVPSRAACGSCHAGIDFSTGKGVTIADAEAGLTTSTYGHVGGAQADDSNCHLCHSATAIPVYHATTTITGGVPIASQINLPPGAASFSYQIKSVTVDATTGNPTVVFSIMNNGTPVTFNAQGSAEMLTGFAKTGPTIEIAYAVPQDGITAPADFNVTASSSVANVWDGTKGTLTGPDSSGFYTAALTSIKIPTSGTNKAVMVTAFLGYGNFTQSAGVNGLDTVAYPSGLALPAQAVQMVATGYTARRQIVDTGKCNACHGQLGLFTADQFHNGQRNDANACAICHNPNRADTGGWSANADYWMHSIHAAGKRTVPFTATAASATDGFFDIQYPGILNHCTTCHLPGTYDFSASASATAVPNRLFSTVTPSPSSHNITGATAVAGDVTLSPYVSANTPYGAGFSYNAATDTATPAAAGTLVISPIMTACVACHDGVDPANGVDAKLHMEQNGGVFYQARSTIYQTGSTTALQNSETCLLCHGKGQIADIAVVHAVP